MFFRNTFLALSAITGAIFYNSMTLHNSGDSSVASSASDSAIVHVWTPVATGVTEIITKTVTVTVSRLVTTSKLADRSLMVQPTPPNNSSVVVKTPEVLPHVITNDFKYSSPVAQEAFEYSEAAHSLSWFVLEMLFETIKPVILLLFITALFDFIQYDHRKLGPNIDTMICSVILPGSFKTVDMGVKHASLFETIIADFMLWDLQFGNSHEVNFLSTIFRLQGLFKVIEMVIKVLSQTYRSCKRRAGRALARDEQLAYEQARLRTEIESLRSINDQLVKEHQEEKQAMEEVEHSRQRALQSWLEQHGEVIEEMHRSYKACSEQQAENQLLKQKNARLESRNTELGEQLEGTEPHEQLENEVKAKDREIEDLKEQVKNYQSTIKQITDEVEKTPGHGRTDLKETQTEAYSHSKYEYPRRQVLNRTIKLRYDGTLRTCILKRKTATSTARLLQTKNHASKKKPENASATSKESTIIESAREQEYQKTISLAHAKFASLQNEKNGAVSNLHQVFGSLLGIVNYMKQPICCDVGPGLQTEAKLPVVLAAVEKQIEADAANLSLDASATIIRKLSAFAAVSIDCGKSQTLLAHQSNALESAICQHKSLLEQKEKEMLEAKTRTEALNSQINHLNNEVDHKSARIKKLAEDGGSHARNTAQKDSSIAKLRKQCEGYVTEMGKKDQKILELTQSLQNLTKKLSNSNSEATVVAQKLAHSERTIQDQLRQLTEHHKSSGASQTFATQQANKIQEMQSQLQTASYAQIEHTQKIKQLESKLHDTEQRLEDRTVKVSGLDSELEENFRTIRSLREQIMTLKKQLERAEEQAENGAKHMETIVQMEADFREQKELTDALSSLCITNKKQLEAYQDVCQSLIDGVYDVVHGKESANSFQQQAKAGTEEGTSSEVDDTVSEAPEDEDMMEDAVPEDDSPEKKVQKEKDHDVMIAETITTIEFVVAYMGKAEKVKIFCSKKRFERIFKKLTVIIVQLFQDNDALREEYLKEVREIKEGPEDEEADSMDLLLQMEADEAAAEEAADNTTIYDEYSRPFKFIEDEVNDVQVHLGVLAKMIPKVVIDGPRFTKLVEENIDDLVGRYRTALVWAESKAWKEQIAHRNFPDSCLAPNRRNATYQDRFTELCDLGKQFSSIVRKSLVNDMTARMDAIFGSAHNSRHRVNKSQKKDQKQEMGSSTTISQALKAGITEIKKTDDAERLMKSLQGLNLETDLGKDLAQDLARRKANEKESAKKKRESKAKETSEKRSMAVTVSLMKDCVIEDVTA